MFQDLKNSIYHPILAIFDLSEKIVILIQSRWNFGILVFCVLETSVRVNISLNEPNFYYQYIGLETELQKQKLI